MREYTLKQLKVIESTKNNTAVMAGAGSGKTSVLVERYIRLLQEGFDCRRILAITFTNKAAGEMAERIRQKMIHHAEKNSAGQKQFWLEQKNLLANAYIGTIHGLCTNIIRANPVEAGVEPDFSVLDETEAMIFTEECLKNSLEKLLKARNIAMQKLCSEYGYKRIFAYLENLLSRFTLADVNNNDFLKKLAKGHLAVVSNLPEEKERFRQILHELLAGIDGMKATAHKKQLQNIKANLIQIEKALTQLPAALEQIGILDEHIDALNARSSDKELVQEIKASKQNFVEICYDNKALQLLPFWAEVVKTCVQDFSAAKRKRGVLTFDDLEYMAYRLLFDNPQLRYHYERKYDHIMMDEFQDTNKLQQGIAYLLAGRDGAKLYGEKLFIVGDDKQSIYRFRGADVSVFGKVREDIKSAEGLAIELLDNFRSRSEILAVCNDLFSQLLAAGEIKYQGLAAGKKTEKRKFPPVEALLLNEEEKEELSEAEAVAARLKQINREEGFAFSDMAVLLRAKTHLEDYIKAFEQKQIPYVVLDGQGFFEVPEIVDLLNLLRFLDNPQKDLALLGVLRSPFFALSDETLTYLILANKEDSYWSKLCGDIPEAINTMQKRLILRAREILSGFLQKANIYPLGVLLRIIVDKLKVMPLTMVYYDAKQRYANIEKLIDIVFAFEYEKNGSLSDFLLHVDNLLAKGARESLEQIESEQSDAVKVLTVHKAKGLQFKVVVVSECGTSFYSEKDAVFYEQSKGFAIKVRGLSGKLETTSFFKQLRAIDAQENTEEMKRLLYVAMTRAEERLILSGLRGKNIEKQSWLNWLLNSFTEQDGYLQGATGKIKLITKNDLSFTETDSLEKLQAYSAKCDIEKLLPMAQPLPAQKQSRFYFSATSLLIYKHCQKQYYYKHVLAMPEFEIAKVEHGVSSVEPQANIIGLIVHEVLQNIKKGSFVGALATACRKYLLPEEVQIAEKNIAPWLEEYIRGSLFSGFSKKKHLNEYRFNLPLFHEANANYWFTGSIDCLIFEDDGSMGIVDFKTDRSSEGKLEEYGMQLAIYKLVAETLYSGSFVNYARLHLVRLNEFLEVDLSEIEAKDIELLCKEISIKEKETDFSPNNDWCSFCNFAYFCPYCNKKTL